MGGPQGVEGRGPPVSQNFILDSSVALAWVFRGEATPQPDLLLHLVSNDAEATAIVADHWALEVTNVLAGAEWKKVAPTTPADTSNSWRRLESLRIERDTETADRRDDASGGLEGMGRTPPQNRKAGLGARGSSPVAHPTSQTVPRKLTGQPVKSGFRDGGQVDFH